MSGDRGRERTGELSSAAGAAPVLPCELSACLLPPPDAASRHTRHSERQTQSDREVEGRERESEREREMSAWHIALCILLGSSCALTSWWNNDSCGSCGYNLVLASIHLVLPRRDNARSILERRPVMTSGWLMRSQSFQTSEAVDDRSHGPLWSSEGLKVAAAIGRVHFHILGLFAVEWTWIRFQSFGGQIPDPVVWRERERERETERERERQREGDRVRARGRERVSE